MNGIDDFSANGILAKTIPDFTPREAQKIMAAAITKAIKKSEALVIEAGTGTGKTFGYLVPALRSGQKTIISTGSKTLQDQLYQKDLPIIKKALHYHGKIVLLKGRRNYLCLERLRSQMNSASLPFLSSTKEAKQDIMLIQRFANQTKTGDISECTQVSETHPIWNELTTTNETCLGSECPEYEQCFVVKARKNAMNADVIVVNHHLFLSDVKLKESGFGELIPQSDLIIFDEAHQVPDLACQYFGKQLSSKFLFDLAKEIMLTYRTEIKDEKQLQACSDQLQKVTQDFRISLFNDNSLYGRGDLRDLFKNQTILSQFHHILETLQFCHEVLTKTKGRSKALDKCLDNVKESIDIIAQLEQTDMTGFSYSYEAQTHYFNLAITPLSVAKEFSQLMKSRAKSWIFTSATLSVNGKFDYFTRRLGLHEAKTQLLESPFDYPNQALFCVPRYLPDANHPEFATTLAEKLTPIIKVNKGRCFLLCTSYFVMNQLAKYFRTNLDLPVLVQGEQNKNELLQNYIQLGNALLIATNSFWEGVDVRGDLLSCVIIDKIPFVSPEDPFMKARTEDLKLKNLDSFNLLQIPEAVIALKQGVGRLIRHQEDRGAVIICDNRLVNKKYGAIFLNSLPPMSRTRDMSIVSNFLTQSRD